MTSQSEILQIAGDGVTLNTEKVNTARLGAFNLIMSYIGTKYTLPITVEVPVLKDCEADITRYYLYDDNPTPIVVTRYDNWLLWLTDVGKGRVQLYDVDGRVVPKTSDASSGSDGFFVVTGAKKIFTAALHEKIDISTPPEVF